MPNRLNSTPGANLPKPPGNRIAIDQSAPIMEAFRTGRLRWASDLINGDLIITSSPVKDTQRCARDARDTHQTTVGDLVCAVFDAMSQASANS